MPAARGAALVVVRDTPPSRHQRRQLSRLAAGIRVRLHGAARDMLAAGRLLLAAARQCGQGTFTEWLGSADGPGLSRTTAYRLMRVAETFRELPADALRNIPKGTLYLLAQREAPPAFREYVVQEVRAGRAVSQTDAVKLLHDYRDRELPPAGDFRSAPAPPRPKAAPEAAHAADNWLALLATLRPGITLHISCTADDENGDATVSVTMLGDGRPRTVARSSLEDAVVEIGGLRRLKPCRVCLKPKRLDEFSRLKDGGDGRNRACLQCERERVAVAKRAARAHPG